MNEYPERPVIGVGGVLIHNDRALLVRRAAEPLRGQWSIPGGTLELGETLAEGVARELKEETGVEVRVGELIEVFERISNEGGRAGGVRPRFHFVVADYLCEHVSGEPQAGSDALEVAYANKAELGKFQLSEAALRVVRKAFELDRVRREAR
jgi:8-oxo-dGTP diphosphatase